jgi:hypothetical protein
MKKGTFTGVWNSGLEVTTQNAKLDEETGEVFYDIPDGESIDSLKEEFFTDDEGNKYIVCPDCNCFVMRDKMFEGEGNGNDYDGQQICSNPYCESNFIK